MKILAMEMKKVDEPKKSQRKKIKYKKHKHVKSIKILAIEKKGLLSKGSQRGKIRYIKT